MKKILLLISFVTASLQAQTDTFTGATSTDWSDASNWSLNTVPGILNDAVIPTGKTVVFSANATIKSLQLQGTAIMHFNGNLSIQQTSTIGSLATFNWGGATLSGGGTLNNLGTLGLVGAGSKVLSEATILNNSGTINVQSDWSLSISDGTLNNLPSGVIDFQFPAQIVGSGAGSHLLNNQGLIKKSLGTWTCTIATAFLNTGTLQAEAGYLEVSVNTSQPVNLNGGIYNASAGAQIQLHNNISCSGTLTGNLIGEMVWAGNVYVPSTATFNFAQNFYWSSGSLLGGGVLNNIGLLTIAPAGSKDINEFTTLRNNGVINITTDWITSVTNGTIDNTSSGIIDFQFPSTIQSGTGGSLHAFNNAGLIKKTGLSTSQIMVDLVNTGTLSSENGSLTLNDDNIILNGGIYNVSTGADITLGATVTTSGTLMGNLVGPMISSGILNIPTTTTLQFSPNSNFDWPTGTITGGGNLINNSTFYFSPYGTKYLDGGTTITNVNQIIFNTDWELRVVNGTINNLASGVIDLQVACPILRNGSGTHALNNAGLIKKTGSTGTANLFMDLNNTGTITSDFGAINFDNLINTTTGTVSGIGSVALNAASGSMTNNGTFSPGGSPGILGFSGNFVSTSNAKFAVELNGLAQGTEHDYMWITGNANLNGSVLVTLNFDPAINDQFIIATTQGLITFGMTPTTTAIYNGMSYTFNVVTQDDNKLKLVLISKTLATEEFTLESQIVLAPNPAKNFITIKNNSNVLVNEALISDASGRIIQILRLDNNDNAIDLGGYALGLYFMRLNTTEGSVVKRFIVE